MDAPGNALAPDALIGFNSSTSPPSKVFVNWPADPLISPIHQPALGLVCQSDLSPRDSTSLDCCFCPRLLPLLEELSHMQRLDQLVRPHLLASAPVQGIHLENSPAFSHSGFACDIATLSLILPLHFTSTLVLWLSQQGVGCSICFGTPCCCEGEKALPSDSKEQILMDIMGSAIPVTAACAWDKAEKWEI